MKKRISLLLFLVSGYCGLARAGDLPVSAKNPVVVAAPDKWTSAVDQSQGGGAPFETYRVTPPGNRNAVALVSVMGKDNAEFATAEFLKKIVRGDCLPYVSSKADLAKVELKEIKIKGGLGFYANFVDPDLAGKPVKKGTWKTATPVILSLGSKYLIKVSILCDEINGADYRDLMKLVESIRIK